MSFILILNSLCIVEPPTFYAAAPVGAVTNTVSLSLNIFLMQATKVLIKSLFPVPPQPIIVIRCGLNWRFLFWVAVARCSHSLIFFKITYAILYWPSFKSSNLYSSPFLFLGIRSLLFFFLNCICVDLVKQPIFAVFWCLINEHNKVVYVKNDIVYWQLCTKRKILPCIFFCSSCNVFQFQILVVLVFQKCFLYLLGW